jgi:hypothetical protein
MRGQRHILGALRRLNEQTPESVAAPTIREEKHPAGVPRVPICGVSLVRPSGRDIESADSNPGPRGRTPCPWSGVGSQPGTLWVGNAQGVRYSNITPVSHGK